MSLCCKQNFLFAGVGCGMVLLQRADTLLLGYLGQNWHRCKVDFVGSAAQVGRIVAEAQAVK